MMNRRDEFAIRILQTQLQAAKMTDAGWSFNTDRSIKFSVDLADRLIKELDEKYEACKHTDAMTIADMSGKMISFQCRKCGIFRQY